MPRSNPKSGVHSDAFVEWLEKKGGVTPYFATHGSDDDIQGKMTKMLPKKYIQQGNVIKGTVDNAEVTWTISTDLILISSEPDAKGLPQLKKIGVQ